MTVTYEELREAVAAADCDAERPKDFPVIAFSKRSASVKAAYLAHADLVLSVVPALGLAIVPREATDEIAEAIAFQAHVCGGIAESTWNAAIAAGEIKPEGE